MDASLQRSMSIRHCLGQWCTSSVYKTQVFWVPRSNVAEPFVRATWRFAPHCSTTFVSQSTGENVFRILLIALLAFGVWKGYEKYQSQRPAQQFQEIDISSGSSRRNRSIDLTPKFQCDGRTHCSQMTSCEEATFFLKNCPGTKMDGNNDGVPCEQQWCK